MLASEIPMIDYGEHYVKQTYRNRFTVLSAGGKKDLSIPVIRPKGNKTPTLEILVSPEMNWKRDHWRTLLAGYSSAPYFEHYQEEVKNLIFQPNEKLVKFNENCLSYIDSVLALGLKYDVSTVFIEEAKSDFRNFNFEPNELHYKQVQFDQKGFEPNLSILDALFCLGPMARTLIKK